MCLPQVRGMLTDKESLFLARDITMLPVYEALKAAMETLAGPFDVSVKKTQIAFRKRYNLAVVSFPYRRMKGWPKHCLILTFVLPRLIDSPRIAVHAEPRPGLFTHHVLLAKPEDIDQTILDCMREAHDYAERPRKREA